jgi:hypothetical protein
MQAQHLPPHAHGPGALPMMPHASAAAMAAGLPSSAIPPGLLALSGSLGAAGAGAPHLAGLPPLGAPGVGGPTTPASLGPGSGSMKNHRNEESNKRSSSGKTCFSLFI